LIHDATFDDRDHDRAVEVHHSTAGEAGAAAAALGVKALALVHISPRYTSTAGHLEDAGRNFPGEIIAPDDLTMVEIPFRD
ncbi:MAG TPA: ribonuclease Z, partial [Methanomicrobiales archaeon]|nr:ribonuclease Z [Methanomicrobiales archaeon]